MAGPHRYAADDLSATAPDADVIEFFEFVRVRLEQARQAGNAAAIGGDAPPGSEVVRFGAEVGQRHHPDEFAAVVGDGGVQVTASFMGLTGPSGVLPENYTERVVDHRRDRDPALGDFLDLFNHRALSHFWRAWAKYRLPVAVLADGGKLDDAFSKALKSLAGLGVAGETVNDEAILSMSGALSRRVRSAGALRRILTGLYGLPIEILELQGRWVQIAEEDQTRLGSEGGAFTSLGHDALAGTSVWDVGSRFHVRIGPLDVAQFRDFFTPDGPRNAMTETIRRAVGGNVDFVLQLVLKQDDVPMLKLDDPARPAALGQSTWLISGPAEGDRDEAHLSSSILRNHGAG